MNLAPGKRCLMCGQPIKVETARRCGDCGQAIARNHKWIWVESQGLSTCVHRNCVHPTSRKVPE